MLPRSKPPNYAPYAAQQMLQPSMLPYSQGGSPHGLPVSLNQVWSSTPPAHGAAASTAAAGPDGVSGFAAGAADTGAAGSVTQHRVDAYEDQQQLTSCGAAAAPGTPGAEHSSTSLSAEDGAARFRNTLARCPGGSVLDKERGGGASSANGAAVAGPLAAMYLALAGRPAPSDTGGDMVAVRKRYPVESQVTCSPSSGVLLHYAPALDVSAATASSATAAGEVQPTLEQQLPPVPASLAAAGPFWKGVAAGRSGHRPRRHSVCTAQIAAKKRMGLAAKGMLFEEMQPFEEADEWLHPRDSSLDSSLASPRQPPGHQLGTDPSFNAMLTPPAAPVHPVQDGWEGHDDNNAGPGRLPVQQ